MKTKIAKQATYWLGVVAIGLVFGLTIQFVTAWTEPTVAPPGGNVGAPINTSATAQTKSGVLTVNPANFLVPSGNSGFGTLTPSYRVDVLGSMRLQPTAAPSGSNGVMYYDSGTNKFRCYQNGAWVDCTGSGTVTNIATGVGLTGGPITSTGTISLNTANINVANCTNATGTGKIYWDATNNRLGCGTDQTGGAGILPAGSSGQTLRHDGSSWVASSNIFNADANVGIGTTIPTAKLSVTGTGLFSGALTVNPANFLVPTGNSGFGTVAPSYRVDILGSMRLQPTAAPAGSNGAMYYDSGTNKFRCYQNGAWVDCVGINTGGISTCTDATTNKIYWNGSQLTCGTDQTGGSGGLTGSGTVNYVAKWTPTTTSLGNSVIYDNGTNVGIGTISPVGKLDVNGSVVSTGKAHLTYYAAGNQAIVGNTTSDWNNTLRIGPSGFQVYVGNNLSMYSDSAKHVGADDYWINSIGKWASQLAISQQCITKRGAAFTNDQVIWCDAAYPNMYSCNALDDQAPASPMTSSCTSDGQCSLVGARTGLGAEMVYLEKVVKAGSVYGCQSYDPDHDHTAYRLDIMCCR